MKPGDIVFFRRGGPISRIIQFAQYMKYGNKQKIYTYWNHVAILVDDKGKLVEAASSGIRYNTLDKFNSLNYVYDIGADDEDRKQMVAFVESCVGESYGWFNIFTIALGLLTRGRVIIGLDGTEICSSLAARSAERINALTENGTIFHGQTCRLTPADLAVMWNVRPLALMKKLNLTQP